jgi:carboxypeptidase T
MNPKMRFPKGFCTVVFLLLPIELFSQELPARTFLLRLENVSEDKLNKGLLMFDEYRRDAVVSYVRGTVMILATKAEAEVLRERGFQPTVVMEDTNQLNLYKRAMYGPTMKMSTIYHTYEQIIDEVDALAKKYPRLIKKFPIGETSQEKRTIYAVKVSDDVQKDQDKPRILFNGCHHADEIMGAEISMAMIHELVEKYETNPEITDWINRYEIFVVPVVNVDGHHVVTHNIDPRWRKNTRDTNGNGVLHDYPEGVDVNRNYDFNWAHGGSDDPMSERYRGPYPFSESENRAMRSLAEAQRFVLSITYHSQGEVIYYPWDWQGRKAPDDKLLTEIANGLAASIKTMKGDTSYKAEYGAGTVGQTYPWLYGSYGTFDFVVETGKGTHIFPEEDVQSIIESNLAGVGYLLNRGKGPGLTGHVIDAVTSKALEATVWFPAIETEEVKRRKSEPRFGRFWRLLSPGKYYFVVIKAGYETTVFKEVEVKPGEWTELTVRLNPTSR